MNKGMHIMSIRLIVFLALFYSFSFCKKTTVKPAVFGNTLLQQIQQDPHLIIFNAAMIRCHLDTAFANGGPYTVFAAPDSAFVSNGWTLARIMATIPDTLKNMISYYIVKGKISTTDLIGFLNENVNSLNPSAKPQLLKNYYGLFFSGSYVVQQIELPDGVLNKLGSFAVPPVGNLYQTILSRPDLTICADILSKNLTIMQTNYSAHVALNTLLQIPPNTYYSDPSLPLRGSFENMTLFLPSDSAYMAAGYTRASIDSAFNADPNGYAGFLVANIVPNWIVENEFFTSSALYTGYGIGNFFLPGPGGFLVGPDGLTIYAGIGNPIAKIIHPNIPATNGVIQIVNTAF